MNSLKLLFLALISFVFTNKTLAYWQQETNYKINVTLNDKNHTISGFETIEYINNSPDTLDHIYMHLWPNGYQDGSALAKQILEDGNTLLYYGEKKYTGAIDSLDFKVNNQSVSWALMEGYKDIARMDLHSPLLPGKSLSISTPFRVKIPVGKVSRLGHLESTTLTGEEIKSYQITQWYPKPAVFDSIGWHRLPYLNQGEFFSEFGNFDVTISTPVEYTVAATGNLIKSEKKGAHNIQNFVQSNVHDFAWFTDNSWITEESEVQLPYSGRTVKTISRYKKENEYVWHNSSKYIDSAIYYYSLWVGDYPYDVAQAVDGGLTAGSGMEYPTVTVIGEAGGRHGLEEVILHEVGHNWFYGILGSNERIHPWLDEGINSYYERRYYEEVKPQSSVADLFSVGGIENFFEDSIPRNFHLHRLMYDYVSSRNLDLPISLSAVEYSETNYGSIVYGKSALALNYLEKYLTKPVFDDIMKEYYQKWKFKHPEPKDLQAIFTEKTGKKLNWFFDDLLNTAYRVDYSILSAGFDDESQKFTVKVANRGDVNSPVVITSIKDGKPVKTVWYEGFNGVATLNFPDGEYDELAIDYYHDMIEDNRLNNRYRMYNVLGKVEPLEAKFFFNFDKDHKTQVFFTPLIGYNSHDKFQLGIGAYNSILKEKPFRFMVMPQYAFGTMRLVGAGKATYSLYPGNDFRKINFNLFHRSQGLDFGNKEAVMSKNEFELDFILRNKNDRSKKKSNLSIRVSNVNLEVDVPKSLLDSGEYISEKNYLTFRFNQINKRVINPYDFSLQAQAFDQNWKLQGELNYHWTVSQKMKNIDIRVFGGVFLENNNAGTERFQLVAGNGTFLSNQEISNFAYNTHDYLFDQVMLGRFVNNSYNLARQQIYINDGGFKTGFNPASSKLWMGAINLTIPTPVKTLSLYADIGSYGSLWEEYEANEIQIPVVYDFGIQLNIIKNYLEVYFPVRFSDRIANNYWVQGVGEYVDDGSGIFGTNLEVSNFSEYLRTVKFMFNINQLYKLYQ